MNPDYDPNDKYGEYKERYAGPPADIYDGRDMRQDRFEALKRQRCIAQVGRVITQAGLAGALVLSFGSGGFKVRMEDGSIVDGIWIPFEGSQKDAAGVSSNGWHIGDIKPESIFEDDDIPF